MKTVLLVWEGGNGNGQFNSLLKIANKLKVDNKVVIASFTRAPSPVPSDISFEFLPKQEFKYPGAYINTIDGRYIAQGLSDQAQLARVFSWYTSLVLRYTVDLIVTDFAPHAQLFAHIRNVPVISVQSAYALPTELPVNRKLMAGGKAVAGSDSKIVTSAINTFIKLKGGDVIPDVSFLYKNKTNIVTSYSVFDIFALVSDVPRDIQYVGAISSVVATESLWVDDYRPKILVYADHTKAFLPRIIERLVTTHDAQVVLVSDSTAVYEELSTSTKSRIVSLKSPSANLTGFLTHADIVLCNANEKIVAEALKSGAALATLPYNPNQIVISDVISGNRVGVRLNLNGQFDEKLTELLLNLGSYKARAVNFANTHLQQPNDPLDIIQTAVTVALS